MLVVTHLPQIACMADRQLAVSKAVEGGRTIVHVRELTDDERVEEIARMMGETEETTTARSHAAEMLRDAQKQREAVRSRG